MVTKFPVNVPSVTEADVEAVSRALREGWISGETPVVDEFEAAFAEMLGVEFALAVANGSLALELAFAALELEPGDEVVLPTFAIISCLAPLVRNRLQPIFVDACLDDWNMDTSAVLDSVAPRTKAILAVHTYGLAANLKPMLEIGKTKNVRLIEDAAEAHGVKFEDSYCGSLGDLGTFSFYANKIITTGEGGMVVGNDRAIIDHVRLARNLFFRPSERFVHDEFGWNARLSSLQAAMGVSQLARLEELVTHKRAIASRYRMNLSSIDGIFFQPDSNPWSTNSYWVCGLRLEGSVFLPAVEARRRLEQVGVASRSFFFPLHLQPVTKKYGLLKQHPNFPIAEKLWNEGLYLPSGTGLSLDHVDEICSRVIDVLKACRR